MYQKLDELPGRLGGSAVHNRLLQTFKGYSEISPNIKCSEQNVTWSIQPFLKEHVAE